MSRSQSSGSRSASHFCKDGSVPPKCPIDSVGPTSELNRPGGHGIGLRVGKVIDKYKVAKHFALSIDEAAFTFSRNSEGGARRPLHHPHFGECGAAAALAKAERHTLDDGKLVHSFSSLMAELATVVRNTCRTPNAGANAPTFEIVTTANAKQKHALELLQQIRV